MPGDDPSEMQNAFASSLTEAKLAIKAASDSERENEAEILAADVFERVSGVSAVSNYAMQHLLLNGGSKFDDNSFIIKALQPGGGGSLYLVYHHTHGICVN